MKSLVEFKSIVEEEKSDYSKFDTLVRAGLANKAQMQRIHKILDKMGEEKPTFNNADRMIIQNLFNKMVDVITNNKQIYQKTRQVVRENIEEEIEEPIILQEDKDPPLVLVIKRKAIRMYPDDTRIALYYSQKLDKHFSVPYGPKIDEHPIQAEENVMHLEDGNSVELTEDMTLLISETYNSLSEGNKNKFLEKLTESIESFEKVYEFCQQHN